MDGLGTLRKLRSLRPSRPGDHVQFADPARGEGDDRGAGLWSGGLRRQTCRAIGSRNRHEGAGARPDSQDQGADDAKPAGSDFCFQCENAGPVIDGGLIDGAAIIVCSQCGRHRRVHGRSGGAGRGPARSAQRLPASGAGGSTHAGSIYRPARGEVERALPAAGFGSRGGRTGAARARSSSPAAIGTWKCTVPLVRTARPRCI